MCLDLLLNNLQRSMVANQMMPAGQQQPTIQGHVEGHAGPKHGRCAQVDAVMAGIQASVQLLAGIARCRVKLYLLDRQLCLTLNHLGRFRQTLPQYSRAQNIVTVDHRLQRGNEGIQMLARIHRRKTGQ